MDLSDEERDELGGIEYRSLKLLAKVLVGMYQISLVYTVNFVLRYNRLLFVFPCIRRRLFCTLDLGHV